MTGETTARQPSLLPERPARRYLAIALSCAVVTTAVYVFHLYGTDIPGSYFTPLHLALELSSIVVSLAVFAVGWYGYRQTGNARELVIAVTFGAAGLVDLIHSLTYQGMPDFLGANSPGKAAAYWLLARLVVGVGLVAASLVRPAQRAGKLWPRCLAFSAAGLVTASTVFFTAYGDPVGHALYRQIGQPPTVLKSGMEFVAIGLYLAAFALLSPRRGWDPAVVGMLRSGLILAVFAELAFTAYTSPFGWMNMLGHVFKTGAYYLILASLFVTSVRRPYEELSRARDELQALYIDAREHRREIEQSFASIGTALSASLQPQQALDLIATLAAEMHHVDCSVVISLDRLGETTQVAVRGDLCHVVERPVDVALVAGRQAIQLCRPMMANDLQSTGWIDCSFTEPDCIRSMVCAPMIYGGEALGMVAVFSHTGNAFEEGDVNLLEGFASHAAVAVHNALSYERESRIADVLQKSLMSSHAVRTDRFEIAQVYQPAGTEALVGGDFYDVHDLADGRIAIAIGDVSGKGLPAAVHTAMVKYMLRAYAAEGHSPAAAMRLLNEAVDAGTDAGTFITMFFGILDGRTAEMVYASAGHEPAIYSHDGVGLTLPATGPALGAGIDLDYAEGRLRLERNGVLLLYTDGISEARSGGDLFGTEGVKASLQACAELSSEEVAACVHRQAIEYAGGELKDDAAILAIRALR